MWDPKLKKKKIFTVDPYLKGRYYKFENPSA